MSTPALDTSVEFRAPYLDESCLRAAVTDKRGRRSQRDQLRQNIHDLDRAGEHRQAALAAYFLACSEMARPAAREYGDVNPNTVRAALEYCRSKLDPRAFTLGELRFNAPEAFTSLSPHLLRDLVRVMRAVIPGNTKFATYAEHVERAVKQHQDDFKLLGDELLEQIASA